MIGLIVAAQEKQVYTDSAALFTHHPACHVLSYPPTTDKTGANAQYLRYLKGLQRQQPPQLRHLRQGKREYVCRVL